MRRRQRCDETPGENDKQPSQEAKPDQPPSEHIVLPHAWAISFRYEYTLSTNRIVSMRVTRCRLVFGRANSYWRRTNPAYAPLSGHRYPVVTYRSPRPSCNCARPVSRSSFSFPRFWPTARLMGGVAKPATKPAQPILSHASGARGTL